MSKGLLDKIRDTVLGSTPAGRFGTDEDTRGLALFLASAASDHIMEQTVAIDGGQSSK